MTVAVDEKTTKFAGLSMDEKLDRLAEVAVRVGLNLRAGQELIMTAPLDALPLARKITEQAYKAGAVLVTTLYSVRCELRFCSGLVS
jgi:aminopeptidase